MRRLERLGAIGRAVRVFSNSPIFPQFANVFRKRTRRTGDAEEETRRSQKRERRQESRRGRRGRANRRRRLSRRDGSFALDVFARLLDGDLFAPLRPFARRGDANDAIQRNRFPFFATIRDFWRRRRFLLGRGEPSAERFSPPAE